MILKEPSKYRKRIMDDVIERHLNTFSAVYLKGPKWSGKTFCCQRLANSEINLTVNDYAQLAEINPNIVLDGDNPRLIDEWQECTSLWDKIKVECSSRNKTGQFLLTGSVNISDDEKNKIHHSGAGRIDKLVLRTCSLYETGESNGSISLEEMFNNPDICIGKKSDMSFEDIIYSICKGGWPYQFTVKNREDKLLLAESYIKSIIDDESGNMNLRLRQRTRQYLRSLARNVQTSTDDETIIKDYLSGEINSSRNEYFELKKIFTNQYLLDYTYAWNPNIRSKTAIRITPKISFVDPSIGVAALGITPLELGQDFNTLGYLFENLVSRDLKVYMESLSGEVYQYRDRNGLECDLVLKAKNGDYALIEVKLGDKRIEEGCSNLLKLSELVMIAQKEGKTKLREPKFMAVITSKDFAYKTDDGIYIIPIGCLKN